MPTRVAVWTKEKQGGYEFAEVTLEPDRLSARGVAIGGDPMAYRLDYGLETGPGFVTTLLDVSSRGAGWSRRLVLRRDDAGAWTVDAETEGNPELPAAGGDATALAGALDCDLGLSPVTNLMPIMRHNLLATEGQVELTMAWVSVPGLAVEPDGQRYTSAGAEPGALRRAGRGLLGDHHDGRRRAGGRLPRGRPPDLSHRARSEGACRGA